MITYGLWMKLMWALVEVNHCLSLLLHRIEESVGGWLEVDISVEPSMQTHRRNSKDHRCFFTCDEIKWQAIVNSRLSRRPSLVISERSLKKPMLISLKVDGHITHQILRRISGFKPDLIKKLRACSPSSNSIPHHHRHSCFHSYLLDNLVSDHTVENTNHI